MLTSQDRSRPVHTWHDKGVPANGNRHPRANSARPVGAFTRGTRASWGETAIGIVPRPTVGLAERQAVRPIARPWRDIPDPRERPDTADGRVTLSGRFTVRSVAAPEPTGPTACGGCWITPCECGRW